LLRHSLPRVINPDVRELINEKNFAALTVLLADGSPMTHIMWVDADDDHVLFNTEVHRDKYKAIQGDPRVAVVVWELADPYHRAEVRGRVVGEVRGPEARAHIDNLSMKYNGTEYDVPIKSERVILKVLPTVQKVIG
jgi:PPOX class probable F420-dependent enzyme